MGKPIFPHGWQNGLLKGIFKTSLQILCANNPKQRIYLSDYSGKIAHALKRVQRMRAAV